MAKSRKIKKAAFKPPTTRRRYEALTNRQRQVYARTRHALKLTQEGGLTASEAAGEAGTTVGSMQRYLGDAIEKLEGVWQAKPTKDRLWFEAEVWTESGPRSFLVRNGSREAILAHKYRDAAWRYVKWDDDRGLADLESNSIDGYTLETDPARIGEAIATGKLDPGKLGSGKTGR